MTEQEFTEIKKELENSTVPKETQEKIMEVCNGAVPVIPTMGRMPKLGKVWKCPKCDRILTLTNKYCCDCGTAIKFPKVNYMREDKNKEVRDEERSKS